MIRINLLPVRAVQKKEKLRVQIVILLLALAATAGACGGVYALQMSKTNDLNAEISKNEAEIARLKKVLGEVASFKKKQEQLQGKLDVLDQIKAGRSGPVRLLDELSSAVPEKLWINSFRQSGGSISIGGTAFNEETVALFMRKLEESPYYKKIELKVVEQTDKDKKFNKFSLDCQTEMPKLEPSKK